MCVCVCVWSLGVMNWVTGPWPHCSKRLLVIASFLQMLMPKKNRIAIYELLFKEGVMVAKKDVHMPKHPELADKNVPNLHVMKAMQVAGGAAGVGCRWRDFPPGVQGKFQGEVRTARAACCLEGL